MGIFSRTALERGNPITKQYDINFNVGGPLWKRQGVVLLQLSPERSVQAHARHRRAGAVEAVQQLHVQGHVPAHAQQPDHRLPEQAQQAAGAARSQQPDSGFGGALSGVTQLPMEIRMDERAWQPRVPRRAGRQLVQLLPARPDRSTRVCVERSPWPYRYDDQCPNGLPRRLSGPEALQAAGLRQPVVLPGWLAWEPRLQGRLRLEARSPVLRSRAAVRYPLPRSERKRERIGDLQLSKHVTKRRRLQRRVHQRHLEVQRSSDVQPRSALRALRRQLPGSVVHAQRPSAAGELADDAQSGRAHALYEFRRASVVAGTRSRRAPSTCRREPASPTT